MKLFILLVWEWKYVLGQIIWKSLNVKIFMKNSGIVISRYVCGIQRYVPTNEKWISLRRFHFHCLRLLFQILFYCCLIMEENKFTIRFFFVFLCQKEALWGRRNWRWMIVCVGKTFFFFRTLSSALQRSGQMVSGFCKSATSAQNVCKASSCILRWRKIKYLYESISLILRLRVFVFIFMLHMRSKVDPRSLYFTDARIQGHTVKKSLTFSRCCQMNGAFQFITSTCMPFST